jgi:hypothetical protein
MCASFCNVHSDWRLFCRFKSRSRDGRLHLSLEVRDLIATMTRENRL